MPTVFINYRRQDAEGYAGRLYDTLTFRVPDLRIFIDVSGLQGGDDFPAVLKKTLTSTDVMLTVIGPAWLTAAKADGTRRLDDPDDFVRIELAEALKRNVAVLPVLVQDALMPPPGELPTDIRELASRNAIPLSTGNWNADVDVLIERLEHVVAERAQTKVVDEPNVGGWRVITERLQARFDRLRRRIIPRSHTWRVVKAMAAVIAFAAVLIAAYGVILYWRGADQRRIDAAAADLRYEQPMEVVNGAILTLREIAVRSPDPNVTNLVIARLKAVVLTPTDKTEHGRSIRKRALETIKTLRQNSLITDFARDDFKEADLVDVDLSRTNMKGLSFEDAFLLRTNFSAADLTDVNLSGAFVRNADFSAATLAGANVEALDWFNAEGFATDQLRAVNLSTLERCPKDSSQTTTEVAFRERLAKEYDFQWEQMWSGDRGELEAFWRFYSKPGGLCAQVDTWLNQF